MSLPRRLLRFALVTVRPLAYWLLVRCFGPDGADCVLAGLAVLRDRVLCVYRSVL